MIRWVNVVGTPFCSAHQSLSPPNSPKKKGEILDRKGLQQLCVCVCVCVQLGGYSVWFSTRVILFVCSSKRRWNCESAACLGGGEGGKKRKRERNLFLETALELRVCGLLEAVLYKAHHFEVKKDLQTRKGDLLYTQKRPIPVQGASF